MGRKRGMCVSERERQTEGQIGAKCFFDSPHLDVFLPRKAARKELRYKMALE